MSDTKVLKRIKTIGIEAYTKNFGYLKKQKIMIRDVKKPNRYKEINVTKKHL